MQDISYNTFQNNAFNPQVIYIDSNKDGSLIIINYIYFAPILITNFQFFNFYIIKNNEIYLLKTPSGFTNSFVTSLPIS